MPWKECSVMDERLQFVARRLAGEPMAELCREFGISRKTGYKIFDRYEQCGVRGSRTENYWSALEDDFRTLLLSNRVFEPVNSTA